MSVWILMACIPLNTAVGFGGFCMLETRYKTQEECGMEAELRDLIDEEKTFACMYGKTKRQGIYK